MLARLRTVPGLLLLLATAVVAVLVAILLVGVNPLQIKCLKRIDHTTIRVLGVSTTAQVVVQCRSGFKPPVVPWRRPPTVPIYCALAGAT
ncbi:MAG: hypothetical protein WB867_07805 [Candidatus Dormiibacterota bacterium]